MRGGDVVPWRGDDLILDSGQHVTHRTSGRQPELVGVEQQDPVGLQGPSQVRLLRAPESYVAIDALVEMAQSDGLTHASLDSFDGAVGRSVVLHDDLVDADSKQVIEAAGDQADLVLHAHDRSDRHHLAAMRGASKTSKR